MSKSWPGWRGAKSPGIRAVILCETQIQYALFRTQLFNPVDLKNVHQIQDSYQVRPLSLYLGNPAPPGAPVVDWPPLADGMSESIQVFGYFIFLLQFCPTHPSEKELMARFTKLGIGPGKPCSDQELAPEIKNAIEAGIAAVWQEDFDAFMKRVNAGEVTIGDTAGPSEWLSRNGIASMSSDGSLAPRSDINVSCVISSGHSIIFLSSR